MAASLLADRLLGRRHDHRPRAVDRVAVVRRRHRARRHGQPRAGDVRDRRRSGHGPARRQARRGRSSRPPSSASLVAVVIGVVVALPALRLGGLPLALATLALAFVGDKHALQVGLAAQRADRLGLRARRSSVRSTCGDRTAFAVVLVVLIAALRGRRSATSSARRRAARSPRCAARHWPRPRPGLEPVRVEADACSRTSAGIAGLGGVHARHSNRSADRRRLPGDGRPAVAGPGRAVRRAPARHGRRRRRRRGDLPGAAAVGLPLAACVPTWLDWDGTRSVEIPAILFGLGAVAVAQNPDGFRRRVRGRAAATTRRRERLPSPHRPTAPRVGGTAGTGDGGRDAPASADAAVVAARLAPGTATSRCSTASTSTSAPAAVNLLLGPNGSGQDDAVPHGRRPHPRHRRAHRRVGGDDILARGPSTGGARRRRARRPRTAASSRA